MLPRRRHPEPARTASRARRGIRAPGPPQRDGARAWWECAAGRRRGGAWPARRARRRLRVGGHGRSRPRAARRCACSIRRLQLLERGMQPDRLEVQESDALEQRDVGIDVARHAQVDDQLRPAGVGHRASDGCRALRSLQLNRPQNRLGGGGAGDQQRGALRDGGVVGCCDCAYAVFLREQLGASGRRVHRDIGGSALAQRRQGDGRIGAGARPRRRGCRADVLGRRSRTLAALSPAESWSREPMDGFRRFRCRSADVLHPRRGDSSSVRN